MVFRLVIVKGSACTPRVPQPKNHVEILQFLVFRMLIVKRISACTSTQKRSIWSFSVFYGFQDGDRGGISCPPRVSFEIFQGFWAGDREGISCPPRVPQPKNHSEVFHFSWFLGWWSWRDQQSPRVYLNARITVKFFSFTGWWSWRDQLFPACTSTQKSFEIFHFSWFLGWWSWRDQLSPACTSTQKSFEIFHFSWFLGWWSWRDQLYPACTSTQKSLLKFFIF